MVLKLLSALLRANKNEQSEFYARQIPKGVFKDHTAEISWIFGYRERHGRYPSIAAFDSRFPSTLLPKTKESVATAAQAVLDADLLEQTSKVMSNAKDSYEGGVSISEVVASMRQALGELKAHDIRYTDVNLGESDSSVKRYIKRANSTKTAITAFNPSPWPAYNKLVGFSEWGENTVVASRTSIGKTWLTINWAWHLAKHGEKVLFVSKEMPTHQIQDRFTALAYDLPYDLFRRADLPPSVLARWKKDERAQKHIDHLRNVIVTGDESMSGSGFGPIVSKISQYRPSALFVDGAYLIWPEGMKSATSLVERIIRISNTMKRICMTHRLRGFTVIQVKREAETKDGDTSASLKDLFGGDAWAQDADNVLLISGKRGGSVRRVTLAKGRESDVGEFNIRFQLNPIRFTETLSVATNAGGSIQVNTL